MSKSIKTREQVDLERCRNLMDALENIARGVAESGSLFGGRSWVNDNETLSSLSENHKAVTSTLREAYRKLSEAEEILEREALKAAPAKRPVFFVRLLLGLFGRKSLRA
jgi:hypothetical protein